MVDIRVGQQTYRVLSPSPDAELHRLAAIVDRTLAAVVPDSRQRSPQALLLAAMALAHELEEERGRRRALESRARELVSAALGQVDHALSALNAAAPEDPEAPRSRP